MYAPRLRIKICANYMIRSAGDKNLIFCLVRVHFERHDLVFGILKERVDGMTLEKLTSGQPLQKRQTVKARRALADYNR